MVQFNSSFPFIHKSNVTNKPPRPFRSFDTRTLKLLGGYRFNANDLIQRIAATDKLSRKDIRSITKDFGFSPQESREFTRIVRSKNNVEGKLDQFLKKDGMFTDTAYSVFDKIFSSMLKDQSLGLSDEDGKIFKEFKKQCNKARTSDQRRLSFSAFGENIADIFAGMRLKKFSDQIRNLNARATASFVYKQVQRKEGDRIGKIFICCIPGHAHAVEIKKKAGKYVISVGNTGYGARNVSGYKCKSVETYVIKTDKNGERDMRLLLRDLMKLHNRQKGTDPASTQANSKAFYNAFNKRCTVQNRFNYPLRPIQENGNCSLRSLEELYYNKLQRMGRADLANTMQDYIIDQTEAEVQHKSLALYQAAISRKRRPQLKDLS